MNDEISAVEAKPDEWKNCVKHVTEEEKMLEMDNFVDIAIEKLVTNIGLKSTESESSDISEQ